MANKKQKPIIVAEWPRNNRQIVRVILEVFKNRNVVDLRAWWSDGDEPFPSKSGLKLDVLHLVKLDKAIKKALALAKKEGLL